MPGTFTPLPGGFSTTHDESTVSVSARSHTPQFDAQCTTTATCSWEQSGAGANGAASACCAVAAAACTSNAASVCSILGVFGGAKGVRYAACASRRWLARAASGAPFVLFCSSLHRVDRSRSGEFRSKSLIRASDHVPRSP